MAEASFYFNTCKHVCWLVRIVTHKRACYSQIQSFNDNNTVTTLCPQHQEHNNNNGLYSLLPVKSNDLSVSLVDTLYFGLYLSLAFFKPKPNYLYSILGGCFIEVTTTEEPSLTWLKGSCST